LPEIEVNKLYKIPTFQFRATQLFRFTFVDIPISTGQKVYQVPLIKREDIEWGLEHGFKYIHIGMIQFGINPLVRLGLNTSCLTCVQDTRLNDFNDALLGGFQNPLNNGPVWSSVIPRYQVSFSDPYINEFLNAYIQFNGFNVAPQTLIAQLHSSICLRFLSSTMPPLNPKLCSRALKEGVIVGPGNTAPLQIGFSECTLPDEWNNTYIPLSQRYPQLQTSKEPRQLSVVKHSDGSSGLKFTSPRLVRSMTILDRSPFLESRDNTKAVIPPLITRSPAPLPVPSIYFAPKRNQKKQYSNNETRYQ